MVAVAAGSEAPAQETGDNAPKGRSIVINVYLWRREVFQPVFDEIGDREFVDQADFDKLDKIRAESYPHGAPAHLECMPGSWTDDSCSHFPPEYMPKKMRVFEGQHNYSWLEPWHFKAYGEK